MPSASLATPIGLVSVSGDAARLCRLRIGAAADPEDPPDALVAEAIAQLRA